MKRQEAYTLIELAVGMGLLIIIGLGVLYVGNFFNRSADRLFVVGILQDLQARFHKTLVNEQAQANTVNANGNMLCIKAHTSCAANTSNGFDLADSGNKIVYPGAATNGVLYFRSGGARCSQAEYDAAGTDCIIESTLVWKAVCPGPIMPSCVRPTRQFNGSFKVKDKGRAQGQVLNVANYSYSYIYTDSMGAEESHKLACEALGGTWSAGACTAKSIGVVNTNPTGP